MLTADREAGRCGRSVGDRRRAGTSGRSGWDQPRIIVLPIVLPIVLSGLVLFLGSCEQLGEVPPPSAVVDPGQVAIRVTAGRAHLGRVEREVVATGMSEAWRTATLRAVAGGQVLALEVDNGDHVEVGDLLLRVDGSRQKLATSGASARVQALQHDVDQAQTELARKQVLVTKGSLARAQLDTAEYQVERARAALKGAKAELGSARRSTKDTRVEAPISGIVTHRVVELGDTLGQGAPLMQIVDLDKIRVRVGLAGSEIARLDTDAPAQVVIEDLGGEPVVARFVASAPAADPVTGLFDVEYLLDNQPEHQSEDQSEDQAEIQSGRQSEARIRGGMVATLELPLRRGPERVLVPRSAITRRGGRLVVFELELDEGEAERALEPGRGRRATVRTRYVRVGSYGEADVEILAGLEVGARVATSAQHALAEGVAVELEPESEPASQP